MAMATLRQWLEDAPFTLAMSSGFFGFYAHAGVLRVLEEERLLPIATSGSSAGALVTGLWAAGLPSEIIVEELRRLERGAFWDPGWGPGFLRGDRVRARLDRLLPVKTFAECRIPARISVFDVTEFRTRAVDAGDLAPAIQASCTVPLLFHPLCHEGRALYDGGILDRPGLAGVGPAERVFYHHLTSRLPPATHLALGRAPPVRRDLVALVIDALPRCDPFHLEEGRRAIELASTATRAALDREIVAASVRYP
jgi:NTE family protein